MFLTNLESQDDNDYAEMVEYYKRYAEDDWQSKSQTSKDYDRKDKYIMCFTKSFRHERFWKEYADSDSGACLGFRFEEFNNDYILHQMYEFRDVFYDDGYDFDFLNEIRYKIYKSCKVQVNFIPSYTHWFACYYKRNRFAWEDETRLFLDASNPICVVTDEFYKMNESKYQIVESQNGNGLLIQRRDENGNPMIKTKINIDDFKINSEGRTIFKLPFRNPYFSIKISEIILGKNIKKEEENEIRRLNDSLYNVPIWQAK